MSKHPWKYLEMTKDEYIAHLEDQIKLKNLAIKTLSNESAQCCVCGKSSTYAHKVDDDWWYWCAEHWHDRLASRGH